MAALLIVAFWAVLLVAVVWRLWWVHRNDTMTINEEEREDG